jgi:16S rRNA C1402 N4-methylase RsmH
VLPSSPCRQRVQGIRSGPHRAAAVGGRHGKIHPATKTFQALRITVNHEPQNIKKFLED